MAPPPIPEISEEEARALGLAPAIPEISDEEAAALGLTPPEPKPEVGKLEAGALGAVQGLTMGFADKAVGLGVAGGVELMGVRARAADAAFGDPKLAPRQETGPAPNTWERFKQMFVGKDATLRQTEAARAGHAAADAVSSRMKRAKNDQPWTYGLAELGGAIASPIKVPIASAARPVLAAAARGAAEGGISAVGHSEATNATDLAKDVALGVGLGGVTGAVTGKVTQKLTGDKAARAYEKQVSKDITRGADPTHARRAVPDADGAQLVTDFVEKYKPISKALGDPDKLAEEAEKVARTLGAATKPVYSKVTQKVGEVPLQRVADELDAAIAARGGPGDETIRAALEETKDAFLKAPDFAKRGSVTHQELRAWVTRLLKQETRTMGSLSETARSQIVGDVHKAGHVVMDKLLDEAAAKAPDLADDIAKVRRINRDITAAARIEQVAKNSDARAFWKNMSLGEKIKRLGSFGLGAGAAVVGGYGHGAAGGAAGFLAGAVGPEVVDRSARAVTAAMGKLARAARAGNVTAQMVEDAIRDGVPAAIARAAATAGARVTAGRSEGTASGGTPSP